MAQYFAAVEYKTVRSKVGPSFPPFAVPGLVLVDWGG